MQSWLEPFDCRRSNVEPFGAFGLESSALYNSIVSIRPWRSSGRSAHLPQFLRDRKGRPRDLLCVLVHAVRHCIHHPPSVNVRALIATKIEDKHVPSSCTAPSSPSSTCAYSSASRSSVSRCVSSSSRISRCTSRGRSRRRFAISPSHCSDWSESDQMSRSSPSSKGSIPPTGGGSIHARKWQEETRGKI